MVDQKIAIFSNRIITPLLDLRDAAILFQGREILAVGNRSNVSISEDTLTIDMGDRIIAPGFYDIHNHGGMGFEVSYDGVEAVRANSKRLVETGCTSWLPTLETSSGIKEVVHCIKEGSEGTDIPGFHMEGPFLAPKDIESINGIDTGLEKPSLKRFQQFIEESEGYLRIMGISIELPGADEIIKEINRSGIVAAIAHSTHASYEQFMQAVDLGIRHVTHTFNVMTGLHHRKPGVVGGALTCAQVTNEIISDGFHVSPVAMDILVRCKGTDNVSIITDNTAVAGLPDGKYQMLGSTIVKKNGETRYLNSTSEMDHTMAGSEWPINHNVRTMVDKVGINLADAVKMASLVPAKITGLDHRIGSLEPGKDADIIVFDENLNIYLTIVKGNIRFDPDNLFTKLQKG